MSSLPPRWLPPASTGRGKSPLPVVPSHKTLRSRFSCHAGCPPCASSIGCLGIVLHGRTARRHSALPLCRVVTCSLPNSLRFHLAVHADSGDGQRKNRRV